MMLVGGKVADRLYRRLNMLAICPIQSTVPRRSVPLLVRGRSSISAILFLRSVLWQCIYTISDNHSRHWLYEKYISTCARNGEQEDIDKRMQEAPGPRP